MILSLQIDTKWKLYAKGFRFGTMSADFGKTEQGEKELFNGLEDHSGRNN